MDPATYEELVRTASTLAARTGSAFRDYLRDPRFSVEEFVDNDHLNMHGARKYNVLLRDEVVCRQVPLDSCGQGSRRQLGQVGRPLSSAGATPSPGRQSTRR
jgi:hypothetical protein